jgi:hypothetical protein
MEALTRLVADSLARHGLDRPIDPRRLQWSRWFRCDSTHSLLTVPSKPGIFALAEEIVDFSANNASVGTAAPGCPAERRSAVASTTTTSSESKTSTPLGGAALQRCDSLPLKDAASAAEPRRMLAVLQFSEDDDMAFVLDRMFTRINPMRERLASGRCFLRFVVIEDQEQRRSICSALNQWMRSSAEKASGLLPDFSSSLELNSVARTPSSATAGTNTNSVTSQPDGNRTNVVSIARNLDSGSAKNLHCPHPLPSGF